MRTTSQLLCTAAFGLLLADLGSAQVAYQDAQGREWRQVKGTTSVTWNALATVCPTDGTTPCTADLGGLALQGWVWATREQVTELFAEFVPAILTQPSVGGPAYTLPGLWFTDVFQPTFEFYTTFGGSKSLSGWTSTFSEGSGSVASVAGAYQPNNGSFSVAGLADPASTSVYRGVWLVRETAFQNLGFGLAGTTGEALLKGSGPLTAGSQVTFTLQAGAPNALAVVALGTSASYVPLLGGTLVPTPEYLLPPVLLNNFGSASLSAPWPAQVAPGTTFFLQAWYADSGAPLGFAASNGLGITQP